MSSTGMLVQCSLQESICKSLVESPIKALQGNALYNTDVEYEQAQYNATGEQITSGSSVDTFLASGDWLHKHPFMTKHIIKREKLRLIFAHDDYKRTVAEHRPRHEAAQDSQH
jgi:hypothetical protein